MEFIVTKDTIISEILNYNKELAKYFKEQGMHCLGCSAAKGETISEACEVHEIDVNKLIEQLNFAIKNECSKK